MVSAAEKAPKLEQLLRLVKSSKRVTKLLELVELMKCALKNRFGVASPTMEGWKWEGIFFLLLSFSFYY